MCGNDNEQVAAQVGSEPRSLWVTGAVLLALCCSSPGSQRLNCVLSIKRHAGVFTACSSLNITCSLVWLYARVLRSDF